MDGSEFNIPVYDWNRDLDLIGVSCHFFFSFFAILLVRALFWHESDEQRIEYDFLVMDY